MLYNWPNWWQPVVKRLFRPLHLPMLWPDSAKSRAGSGATVLWRGWVLLVLLLQSHAALALGLGNIRVLSQPGEPLIAEIPLLSNNPEELDGATATLASADTFKRVGLPTPRGQVRELQFAFAQDHNERAVIRVSTASPIQVPALSFLIEVNWAQGRIVREYSTLVSTPETLTALSEPPIELPQGAQSDLIVREMEPAYDPLVMPLADDIWKDIAEQTAEKSPIGTEIEAESAFTIIPSTPKPPARSTRSPTSPSRFNSSAIDGQQVTVQRGQTLGQIAGELARKNGQSLDQTMIAMLRVNPQAFINGNLNLLREGAVLRVPNQDELNQLSAVQANAMVREHMTQWQQYRGPILQPAVATVSEPAITTVPIETPPRPSSNDARLEIAPAVTASQPNAQSTTGLEAGGTGNQLGLSAGGLLEEELASREAELQELRERVSALEALQKKQQALIELKDSDLAAAQQRLAEVVETPSEGGWGIWLVGGLLLLALASGGAWLLRRRSEPTLAFEDEDFSEIFGLNDTETETDSAELNDPLPAEETENLPAPESDRENRESAQQTANQANSSADRSWSNTGENVDEVLPEPEPVTDPRERLELAVAYLDLGDTRTARNLLNEVATGPDPKLRKEALELLERLNWIN